LFSAQDKRRILRGGAALLRPAEKIPAEWTVADWLNATRQGEETRRSFWEPLSVAIMNERPYTASARVFVRSLRKAFLESSRGAALAVPTVGLSRLYADAAEAYLLRHQGVVQRSAEVVELVVAGDAVAAVRLKNGRELVCSAVVIAVPPARAAQLLPGHETHTGLFDMPVSPIVSAHLWFDRGFMHEDAVGVIGRTIQWVFRKKDHLSVTISAAHEIEELDNREITRIALEDLRAVYGTSVGALRHSLVLREKRATISCTPDVERRRPGNRTSLPNVALAGDWTNTGLPATIEGAVISGNRAAEVVLEVLRPPR
jgi:squalene-associated FAD-dependent desaturase